MTYAVCKCYTNWHSRGHRKWQEIGDWIVVHKLALRGSSALACLQEGARAAVVFCQQGSTTLRCVQVSQLTPVKGSKEKPGGQLRTDNKKPIVALAAAPCQKLEVLVLYVDGSLSSCTCNPATRVMATRWCIAVDPGTVALHQVRQRTPSIPDPTSMSNRTSTLTLTAGAWHDRLLWPAKCQQCLTQTASFLVAPAYLPQKSWLPLASCTRLHGSFSLQASDPPLLAIATG